jgi:Cytochrome c7 and related cytochrome c
MTRRRKWAAIPGLVAVAALAATLSAYSGASSPEGRSPEQPIAFPHPAHVQKLGMNCVYCHFSANKAADPGLPAVATCMGCHTVIGPNRPARDGQPARTSEPLTQLAKYWNNGTNPKPVPWVRIHKVPEYVRFPHMRHVNAGVTCQTCHGQVQKMNQVYQAASLNMGWCINCHVNGYNAVAGKIAAGYTPTAVDSAAPVKRARYDCSVCHY